MARYTGPKSKVARRFREAIFGKDKALEKERKFGQLTRETTGDLFTEGRIKDTGKARKTSVEIEDTEQAIRGVKNLLNSDLNDLHIKTIIIF